MLSLGLGLNRSAKPPKALLLDFSNDTPAADFFNSYSVNGGALTFTTDETISGVTGNNFLKIVYPQIAQTGVNSDISGVRMSTNLIESAAMQPGFYWQCTFDVYLEDDSAWTTGADNDVVSTVINFGGKAVKKNVNTDELVSVDTGQQQVSNPTSNFLIYFSSPGDIPGPGATWYIRNLTVKLGKTASSIA